VGWVMIRANYEFQQKSPNRLLQISIAKAGWPVAQAMKIKSRWFTAKSNLLRDVAGRDGPRAFDKPDTAHRHLDIIGRK